MIEKSVPIGIEFYKQMIDKNYYYVDKTMIIKELLDNPASVSLFTRPRRFGKTLTMNMLKTFFEDERDLYGNKIDNHRFFEGKKITFCGEKYMEKMEQYPVISLSLKSAKQPEFGMAYRALQNEIRSEFRRHQYVCRSALLCEDEKVQFNHIMAGKADSADYATAFVFLSECLKKYHHKNVIILIDEYDVPLENANFSNFYDQMAAFIRSLFESALKTNENLEFAVITGCLRISRESIFTGLNNLKIISILRNDCAEYFGFTPEEVHQMLVDYNMTDCEKEVQSWYDGYLFGETEVYNPWSVINYIDENRNKTKVFPQPYWSNTSSNSIVRDLIENADSITRKEIEDLVAGGTIEKPVHEDITYENVHDSQDNLWNFLFFTGYLKKIAQRQEQRTKYLTMAIPNEEVLYIYENTIQEWLKVKVKKSDFTEMYSAILEGDTQTMESCLKKQLRESISFMDSAENFYHGFLLGLLGGLEGYEKLSNRESGEGRYDIVLKPYDEQYPAIILEIKKVQRFTEMEEMCQKALQQIENKHYAVELEHEGYSIIKKYGICFCKKSCMVKIQE